MKIPVFILFGPTASGKTAILEKLFSPQRAAETDGQLADPPAPGWPPETAGPAVKLPLAGPAAEPAAIIPAEIISAEIISADSMQVYRGMDIGTAKPSPAEREKIRHHLIDIRNPDEQFNAGEFVRLAEEACFAAHSRGNLPVVSGGTGFYLKNLVLGLPEAPPSDEVIRSRLKEELASRGAAALMEELAALDPQSAQRIHINDEYRLLRALEVCRLTGKPLSSFASPWTPDSPLPHSPFPTPHSPLNKSPFHFLIMGLRRKREDLYRRINERSAAMFRAGLASEVKRLFEAGYTPLDPGLRAIGYREFFIEEPAGTLPADTLAAAGKPNNGETATREPAGKPGDIQSGAGGEKPDNKTPANDKPASSEPDDQKPRASFRLSEDLAGVEALIAQNSRRYAKRQITFFASIPGVKWIDCENEDDAVRAIRGELEGFLSRSSQNRQHFTAYQEEL